MNINKQKQKQRRIIYRQKITEVAKTDLIKAAELREKRRVYVTTYRQKLKKVAKTDFAEADRKLRPPTNRHV